MTCFIFAFDVECIFVDLIVVNCYQAKSALTSNMHKIIHADINYYSFKSQDLKDRLINV